jgi:hypothetical protein
LLKYLEVVLNCKLGFEISVTEAPRALEYVVNTIKYSAVSLEIVKPFYNNLHQNSF